MQKMMYKIFIIMILVICSMSFSSCEAITAQNITHNGSSRGMNGGGMNGGFGGMGGGPGTTGGGPGMNDSPGMDGNMRGEN